MALPPIRLISYTNFKNHGCIPRYPDNKELVINLDDLSNEDKDNSFFIFISHCWLRGQEKPPHPDTMNNDKYHLCVAGIEQVLDHLVDPSIRNCYLWCDFSCIDQDGDPAGELKQLDQIVSVCDCIFTPLHDPNHENRDYHVTDGVFDWYKEFHAYAWNGGDHSYLNRGWCRIEMFYSSNIPKQISPEKLNKLKFGLNHHLSLKRRPHILYTSKEMARIQLPKILPPLRNSYYNDYNPILGKLTKEDDRKQVQRLVNELQAFILPDEKPGYYPEIADDPTNNIHRKHGKGKYIWENGDIYDGDWKDNLMAGQGKFIYANGDIHEGKWQNSLPSGKGIRQFNNGIIYSGNFHKGKCDGIGEKNWPDGSCFLGDWKENQRHGLGKLIIPNKVIFNGTWKHDKKNGSGYFTSVFPENQNNNDENHNFLSYYGAFIDDKKTGSWIKKLKNGKEIEEIWENGHKIEELE
jgi:hypothetical protein